MRAAFAWCEGKLRTEPQRWAKCKKDRTYECGAPIGVIGSRRRMAIETHSAPIGTTLNSQIDGPTSSRHVWIPGRSFGMGSDAHYPEERPVHRAAVEGFRI